MYFRATPVANIGTVQRVTERPSFGVAVDNSANEVVGVGSIQVVEPQQQQQQQQQQQPKRPAVNTRKNAANEDFRQRLRSRFQNFKKSLNTNNNNNGDKSNVGRGSVTPIGSSSSFSNRRGTFRQERQRGFNPRDEPEQPEQVEIVKPSNSVRFRPKSRYSSNIARFRQRNRQREEQQQDLEVEASNLQVNIKIDPHVCTEVFGSAGSVGNGRLVRYSRKFVILGCFNAKFQFGDCKNVHYFQSRYFRKPQLILELMQRQAQGGVGSFTPMVNFELTPHHKIFNRLLLRRYTHKNVKLGQQN